MAVLNPVKLVIDNYPEGKVEYLEAENNPERPELGTRKMPFSRVLYIEREDFAKCRRPNSSDCPRQGSPAEECVHYKVQQCCKG